MGLRRPLLQSTYVILLAGILFSSMHFLLSLYSRSPLDSDLDAFIQRVELQRPFLPPTSSQDRSHRVALDAWRGDVFEPPTTEKGMPPLSEFKLTKELVASRAKNNIIFLTFGNHAFLDMIENWARHMLGLNLHNFIVGAMDAELLEALYWKGIPVFHMGSATKTADLGWGTPAFHRMGRSKISLLATILPFGFEVLMTDTDTVWLKNPLPYLAQFPEADVLVSTDSTVLSSTDDYLDKWGEMSSAYNIGIFHWRPTEIAMKFVKEWNQLLISDDKIWDQIAFNDMMRKNLGPSVGGSENGLVYAYNRSLKLGILPASIFCSGHTYFIQRMARQLDMRPYVVHSTYQLGGSESEGKRHRLREALLFYDPPEYFDSPGGYLAYKPRIPTRLLKEGEKNVESHFALVNYQLKQIRDAFAIASLLNRTLVMPRMLCRSDILWFGHPGIIPLSVTPLPFLCPMDHVLKVPAMLANYSEDRFGPRLEFREYSFLENPLLPEKVKESVLHVQLCVENSTGCNVTAPGLLRLPFHRDQDALVRTFSAYKDVKILEFSTMNDVFKGFKDKEREKRFRRRVSRYTSLWCCVQTHNPGHIYYDMFWDEKPDWKPLPPRKAGGADDRPKWVD